MERLNAERWNRNAAHLPACCDKVVMFLCIQFCKLSCTSFVLTGEEEEKEEEEEEEEGRGGLRARLRYAGVGDARRKAYAKPTK